MASFCCTECFGDRLLKQELIPSRSSIRGKCSYCGSDKVDLIEPGQLLNEFEVLLGVYEPDPNGRPIVDWLKRDWGLFPGFDVAHAKELLVEILDDGEIVRGTFSRSSAYESKALAQWEVLKEEILHTNRYFLDGSIDTDRLEPLLLHLANDDLPDRWFRARIQADDNPFDISRMGAPPRGTASFGRANPVGIPYLYLGSLPETAVAEIRPHTGEVACVATFDLVGRPRVIDLRNPREFVSPFVLEDASAVGQLLADIPFLERLGEELTRPVLPRSAAVDYIPSQYLCEFIKKSRYDGVLYRSSVSTGMNLALFDPLKATGGRVDTYTVSRVSVAIDRAA